MSTEIVSQERMEQMLTLLCCENSFNISYTTWALDPNNGYGYLISVIGGEFSNLSLCSVDVKITNGHHNIHIFYNGGIKDKNGPFRSLTEVKSKLLICLQNHIALQPQNIQDLFRIRERFPGLIWRNHENKISLHVNKPLNTAITTDYTTLDAQMITAIEAEYCKNPVRKILYDLHKTYQELKWNDLEHVGSFDFNVYCYQSGKLMFIARLMDQSGTLITRDENGNPLDINMGNLQVYLTNLLETNREIASGAPTSRGITTTLQIWHVLNTLTNILISKKTDIYFK